MLNTLFFQKEKILYDGSQLISGWIEKAFNLKGDSLVSFMGGCDVKFEHMVDLSDLAEKNLIKSDLMLHFIGEFFISSEIYLSFALQRIFVLLLKEVLESLSNKQILREGDDLFLILKGEKRKLSISIATVSSNSSLFHFGLNLTEAGAPVKVATLDNLGVKAEQLVLITFQKFSLEYQNIKEESQMVRIVGRLKD